MKQIYIVFERSSDYESIPEAVRAFEIKDDAILYKDRLEALYRKLYNFYSEKAGNPSHDEVMSMEEEIWKQFDYYRTKSNRYYGVWFFVEDINFSSHESIKKFNYEKNR